MVIYLLFSLRCISPNSHHHCIRQTSRCFAPFAISRACHVQTRHYSIDIYIVNKFYHCLDIQFPSEKQWNGSCSYFTGRVFSDNSGICSYLQSRQYHQNQIYSQNQLQNAQTREALRQRKSAYNTLFVYFVFLVCYLPHLPSVMLYLTDTSKTSFLIAKSASPFLIYLNSSFNPIVYCWRYREIRQIVKSTMKKILRMDENMTWGCEVLKDEIWRERAIREGTWDELTFAKTSGNVTRNKGKRANYK